jgi:perosamine synthetase
MSKIILSPPRQAFSREERAAVNSVVAHYMRRGTDMPYLGPFQEAFEDAFVRFMDGRGFARAVSSGTAACFVAFQALKITHGARAHVLMSPVADAGLISALVILGIPFTILDSAQDDYNVTADTVLASLKKTKATAVFLVHAGGYANRDVAAISALCSKRNVMLIEDISQCPGAIVDSLRVGTFGDMAVCSAMYRKSLYMGSQGGVVFSKSTRLSRLIISLSDRGKTPYGPVLSRTPGRNLFPALNWNSGEIQCAIGLASLKKVDRVNKKRIDVGNYLAKQLSIAEPNLKIQRFKPGDAPFFMIATLDSSKKRSLVSRKLFDSGIPHNPKYDFLVHRWKWLKRYLSIKSSDFPRNADRLCKISINLYIHEGYSRRYVDELVSGYGSSE